MNEEKANRVLIKGKKISDYLIGFGKKFHLIGKWAFLIGAGILVIEFLIILISGGEIGYMLKPYDGAIYFFVLSCIGIGVGLPLYLSGLLYMGIGQIAKNTDK